MKVLDNFSKEQRSLINEITKLLGAHTKEIYLVGGCVRDSILGLEPKDIDIEIFNLTPEKIESLLSKRFRVQAIGKSFGVFILKGKSIDISIPRKEYKIGPKHKDFKIIGDPFMGQKEAASRRDFTINSISYNLRTKQIIDPFKGVDDLNNKLLKHVSKAFVEDPLRVLRAMQFVSRFNLDTHPKTIQLCKKLTPQDLPKERVWEEWKKLLLKGKQISKGLDFLNKCGWLKYFKELHDLKDCKQEPEWHPEGDVFNHTKYCLNAFALNRTNDDWEDLIVGLAVMCHDMGKPETTIIGRDGKIRSPKHDIAGIKTTKRFLSKLTNQKKIFEEVIPLVETHMRPYSLYKSKAGDSAVRRLASKVKRIDRLLRVVSADQLGRPPIKVDSFEEIDWLKEKAEKLKIDKSVPKPIIQGKHLIDLGIKPGPIYKKILNICFEAQINGKFKIENKGKIYLKRIVEEINN